MQRSSESIGAIAAALAKAQAELSNPEKSLIGIIGPSTPREPGRVFRYAPLSSGPGDRAQEPRAPCHRHLQSTAIDREAGLVRLNTVLAHASGEWVASEWPVCRIGDLASPQRMGAALTYARRYVPCSRWSGSPETTISTLRILAQPRIRNLPARLGPTANPS